MLAQQNDFQNPPTKNQWVTDENQQKIMKNDEEVLNVG
jgi:hypothetical protein